MEGGSHLLAAAVLNSTRFYTLVNMTSYEAHNLILGETPEGTADGENAPSLAFSCCSDDGLSNAKMTLMTSG